MKEEIEDLIQIYYKRISTLEKRIDDLTIHNGNECCYISEKNMITAGLYKQQIRDLKRFINSLNSILGEKKRV